MSLFLMLAEAQRTRVTDSRWPLHPVGLAIVLSTSLAGFPAGAQPITAGVGFLTASQDTNGSWQSNQVRAESATTAALRALQAVAQTSAVRSAAADFLESASISDSDDRARRLIALAVEGRDTGALADQLIIDATAAGGWGLSGGFAASPFDNALALAALAPGAAVADPVLQASLLQLLAVQMDNGGWPCSAGGTDSDLYCTAQAILALAPYRVRFFFDPQIDAATDFLKLRLNPDGSFGDAGRDQLVNTTLAALALAAVPAFGAELVTVVSFLENRQQADGSWEGDPYATALALRALAALSTVPFCGDGIANQVDEACDGTDLTGLTCEDVGLGSGTLSCSPQCTLDTLGCSAPPECGDDLRNLPFEVCDGSDLAAESCESLGFESGSLGCGADCLSFDVSACNAAASCNDGVVNLPNESCDLSDLNGLTCEVLGLGGGILSCDPDCSLDTSGCDAAAFETDNQGREFFVGFLATKGRAGISVHLTSAVPTSVTVQWPAVSPSYSQTLPVNPGAITVVSVPPGARSGWSAGQVLSNAVRLSSPDDFVAYLVNSRRFSSDAAMALPVDALGTSFIVTTFRGSSVHSGDRSQFLVVAPFDSTTVTMTPTATMHWLGSTTPAGTPVEVVLDRGQGIRGEAVGSTADLTGTLIESDRPISVLNGNICANVPSTTVACDHIFETAHPVATWGTATLVTNLPDRPGGSIYRVVAAVDGTDVTLDGALQTTLDRGQFLELGPLPGRHVIEANHPVFVTQFMTGDGAPGADIGDPAMANMIPPEQFLTEYTFSTV
ncbi:MAG: prenyltransferase/squalene oxidase repeat-containing protein, partial [Thermoanaerobaculia bacterium]